MWQANKRRDLLSVMGVLGLGAWPLTLGAQLATSDRPVRIGVLPITSTRILLRNYALIQSYLEQTLKQPVELVTAADFRTFHLNTLQGQYDLVVTAVHFARMAQLEAGWLPLVRYGASHQTLLMTLRERPLRRLEDVRGSVVAGPDVLTLVSMEGQDWLRARGLTVNVDYTYLETPTTPSSAHALINGQSMLFFGTPQGLLNTPRELADQLAVFAALPERPNLTWLAHPRLASQRPFLKSSLQGLNAPSANVKSFFDATGYQGVREVADADLATSDKYLPRLREALERAR